MVKWLIIMWKFPFKHKKNLFKKRFLHYIVNLVFINLATVAVQPV